MYLHGASSKKWYVTIPKKCRMVWISGATLSLSLHIFLIEFPIPSSVCQIDLQPNVGIEGIDIPYVVSVWEPVWHKFCMNNQSFIQTTLYQVVIFFHSVQRKVWDGYHRIFHDPMRFFPSQMSWVFRWDFAEPFGKPRFESIFLFWNWSLCSGNTIWRFKFSEKSLNKMMVRSKLEISGLTL